MTHHNPNSDFLIRTARAETEQRIHTHHPSEDTLLALLSGDLANEQRSRLHAHLATCSECHTQWRTLGTLVTENTHSLQEQSTVPSLAAAIQKNQAASTRSHVWWKSLFETRVFVAAGSAAAALVLAFVVMIPALQNSSHQTSEQFESLSAEIRILQGQIQSGGPFNEAISNYLPAQGVTEELLLAYDWDDLITYTSQQGDTWETIAADQLGNGSLWPLLWILNRNLGLPGEKLVAGTLISIPRQVEQ